MCGRIFSAFSRPPDRTSLEPIPMTLADVEQLEERLRLAMLASDADALDELASDRLRFVTLAGAVVGKETDLDAHRTGTLRLSELAPVDPDARHVELLGGDVALVNVAMRLAGRFAGANFAGIFRYTRVWCREDGRVRIVAGQVCAVQGELA